MQHKNTPPHHQELDFNEGTWKPGGGLCVCMLKGRLEGRACSLGLHLKEMFLEAVPNS